MPGRHASRPPLRLWPGVAAASVLLVALYVVPMVTAVAGTALIVGFAGVGAVLLWWLLLSRAPWPERVGALAAMVLAVLVTRPFLDPSIATGGMGAMQVILALPAMCLALVIWALAESRVSTTARLVLLPALMLVACAPFVLLRTAGIGNDTIADLHWRWTPTPEERLLAEADNLPTAPASGALSERGPEPATEPEQAPPEPATTEPESPAAASSTPESNETAPLPAPAAPARAPEWPGFRGPGRDGVVRGVRIDTDWTVSPPVELWRRAIGPGWSSFAVDGDRIYTQEQRGGDEIVACYSRTTGEPVWAHRDSTRFWESNGGPGPRATPTLSGGRVYTFGGTGIVSALEASTGAVVWQRHATTDAGAAVPDWGFASSPLVVGDVVVVAAGGQLVGYDRDSGRPRWVGAPEGFSYSSPQLATIDGVPQVLLLSGTTTSVSPTDGRVLWQHAWGGGAIVQPALTGDGDVVVSSTGLTGGAGLQRVAIQHGAGGWTTSERWTSSGLKPYFNDFVIHEGHAYGFDGSILSSIDLADGHRTWKGGRYGAGQLILLAEQDLLLVLAEDGDLSLVSATPDSFAQIARVPALEGKTWNHPVLVGDTLLVRNGEEMAAFRLTLETN